MASCKECLHYELCKRLDAIFNYYNTPSPIHLPTSCSDFFKNKADFVEVVRCKDCSVPHNKWTGCPNLNGLIPPPDFYCARGERRETNGNAENET